MAKTQPSTKRPKSGVGAKRKLPFPSNPSSKRRPKNEKSPEVNANDIYEYAPTKNRRANVKLNFDKEEIGGIRSGLPDGEDSDTEMDKIRERIAANMDGDLGVIESDDDDELDSDAAFEGESDEERFANFTFVSSVCHLSHFFILLHAYPNIPSHPKRLPRGVLQNLPGILTWI